MSTRVLYIIDTSGPGGAETVLSQLVSRLDGRKYLPYAILGGKGWLYDMLCKCGVTPTIIPMAGGWNVKYLLKLCAFIIRNRIGLIHAHLIGASLHGSIAGLLCGIPVISTIHGTVGSSVERPTTRLAFRIISGGSKYIVCVSEYLRDYYLKHARLEASKTVRIHNGVDCERFLPRNHSDLREELGIPEEAFCIGAVGNIRAAKGYDVFLKAAALVVRDHPDCKFLVAGEGDGALYRELLKLREDLGLEKAVLFLGFREDIVTVLGSMDLFVLASKTEGFSIVTLEAMAAGVVPVVTDSGGPREIVTHGRDGIIVRPDSVEDLADGILTCVRNRDMLKNMRRHCRETVKERFALKDSCLQYENLYESCLQ